ncbi:creatininase family protein [Halocatena salina]|uniref:Creatininase family protein n=1 Tax=Halocatena salina TaxID=2934340 RepID=A0A8U0A580_9EURY|nr:creatininase family protein [Halocatena salina]UPM44361.1 creatininase family protein [Halocatena salina]
MSSHTSVRLAEHTWTEIETALEDGTRTVIVAIGSVEQHGPHLPLVMDTLAGDELSRRIAQKLGDALAAPTIRPGCSSHHMEFPGTITIPASTLMELIRAHCQSLDEHGFEYIVLVPTHGGNFAPTNTVAPEIARDIDATVITLADLEELMELQNEGLRTAGVDYQESSIHAGAVETSEVLAINEDHVRTDEYEVGVEGAISPSRLLSRGFKSITENGVLGDPRKATRKAGEEILETVATAYAEQIEAERDAV